MKKLLIFSFTLLACGAFAQTQKNGTIYKEHPYIDIVNKANDQFLKQDWIALAGNYADTVKFYDPTSEKPFNLETEKKMWADIYANWDQVSSVKQGYPDGLEYDKDPFTVQSWWIITAINKKTKKSVKVFMVQFDTFNKAGKIDSEATFYDQTPFIEATK